MKYLCYMFTGIHRLQEREWIMLVRSPNEERARQLALEEMYKIKLEYCYSSDVYKDKTSVIQSIPLKEG